MIDPAPIDTHGLPDGYDAADLLAEGAQPWDLADPEVITVPGLELKSPSSPPSTPDDDDGYGPPADPPRTGMGDERRMRIKSGDYHAQVIEALTVFIDEQGITPDAVGGWLDAETLKPVSYKTAKLVNRFLFRFRHRDGISGKYVEETLQAIVDDRRDARRAELIARITGRPATPAGNEALLAWVRAVTGLSLDHADEAARDTFIESVTVVRHWLWLIKRMALGLRTEHDIMPIIYGPQGSGKSTATEMLCAILAELASPINSSYLTDERKFESMATLVVGRWEEMQGSQKSDIEALKFAITTPIVAYRHLGTHINERLMRTCGFIGTSNNPVDVMIADFTGARRFYQITTPQVIDRDAINSLDAALVWQSVSEDDPAPITPILSTLRATQQQLVQRDAVSLWLLAESWKQLTIIRGDTYGEISIPPYDAVKGESFEHISARFKHWCATVGNVSNNAPRFAQRLQQEGFTQTRPRSGEGPRVRLYHRPVSSQTTADGQATGSPAAAAEPLSDDAELRKRGLKLRQPPTGGEDRFVADDGKGATDAIPFDDDPPF